MTVVNKWFKILYDYPTSLSGIKIQHFSLTQTGTGAPIATVKYNGLGGTIVWERTSDSLYKGVCAGLFTGGSAKCSIQPLNYNSIRLAQITDDNTVTIQTVEDGDLYGHEFIITVYP